MIMPIKINPDSYINKFEINALKRTGTAFMFYPPDRTAGRYVLNIINKHTPEITFRGIVLSLASIVVMGDL